jgi:hypothetical protein
MTRVYRDVPSHTRGGSRMLELGTYGSVRGERGNSRPYRDHCSALAHVANSGIFPAQSLKQGTKCRISTTRRDSRRTRYMKSIHRLGVAALTVIGFMIITILR